MNKKTTAAAAALLISAAAFADGFTVSGYLRAGLSSTFEEKPVLNTNTWLGGIYFNGDSAKTRGRVNIAWDGKNDAGNSYGAFLRLEYTGADEAASESWGYGGVSYAQAYAGLFGNVVTVAAGKLKDNWIASSGFEAYSVLDKKSGAAITITPLAGLNLTGAAIIDPTYDGTPSSIELNGNTFLGGAKYTTGDKLFTAAASFAGYGTFVGNVVYSGTKDAGVKGLLVSAETTIDTHKDTADFVQKQRAVIDEQVQYTGIDQWTFGVLAFQYLDKTSVDGDSDFTLAITPAVAYQLNSFIKFSVEGTINVPVYDDAPKSYATIVPAVTLISDKMANVYVWTSISTDQDQAKSCAGVGVKRDF
ncbi:MAG TPA: hypothetical protein DCL73_10655 [Treponema sp.]|nr:hypothetical protein [Treponema sp.]